MTSSSNDLGDDDDFLDEAPTSPVTYEIPDPDVQPPLDLDPAEMQFLDQIRETPQDFPLRVVYADWLEQQGDLHKAELVRLLSVAPREGSPERDRIRTLGAAQPHEWMAIVSRSPIDGCEQQLRRLCSQRWESLTSTDDPRIRHCGECGDQVSFCASQAGVAHHSYDPMQRVAYSPLLEYASACFRYDSGMIMGPQQHRIRSPLRLRRLDES